MTLTSWPFFFFNCYSKIVSWLYPVIENTAYSFVFFPSSSSYNGWNRDAYSLRSWGLGWVTAACCWIILIQSSIFSCARFPVSQNSSIWNPWTGCFMQVEPSVIPALSEPLLTWERLWDWSRLLALLLFNEKWCLVPLLQISTPSVRRFNTSDFQRESFRREDSLGGRFLCSLVWTLSELCSGVWTLG